MFQPFFAGLSFRGRGYETLTADDDMKPVSSVEAHATEAHGAHAGVEPAKTDEEPASPAEEQVSPPAAKVVQFAMPYQRDMLEDAVKRITGVLGASLAGVSRVQGHYGGRVLAGEDAANLRSSYDVIASALYHSHAVPGAAQEQLIAKSALQQVAQALAGGAKRSRQARTHQNCASTVPALFFDDAKATPTDFVSIVPRAKPGLRSLCWSARFWERRGIIVTRTLARSLLGRREYYDVSHAGIPLFTASVFSDSNR